MRVLSQKMNNRKINYSLLSKYGFNKTKEEYIFEKNILENQFKVIIYVKNNELLSQIIDLDTNDEYLLCDVENIKGEFVGTVKTAYEEIINCVIDNCTDNDIFKSIKSKKVIKYD